MERKTTSPCVYISDANRSTEYYSDKDIHWYLKDAIRGFTVSNVGTVKSNRNHHPCQNESDAHNLLEWMNSYAARLIFVMWATTHRNIGSNLGQVPAIILSQYSDQLAYKELKLDKRTIKWIEHLKVS